MFTYLACQNDYFFHFWFTRQFLKHLQVGIVSRRIIYSEMASSMPSYVIIRAKVWGSSQSVCFKWTTGRKRPKPCCINLARTNYLEASDV